MRKPRWLALLLILPVLAACSSKPKPQATEPPKPPETAPVTAPVTPPPPTTQGPQPSTAIDLMQTAASRDLTLDDLKAGLEALLNKEGGTPGQKLSALFQHWQMAPRTDGAAITLFTEGDLDGDGNVEIITALNGRRGTEDTQGRLAVIYKKEQRYVVDLGLDRSASGPMDEWRNVYVNAVKDLTGDGKPEIIWMSEDHGAHTSYAYFYVSSWQPGQFTILPGSGMYTTFPKLTIDGTDLLVQGGTIGSAGAGIMQRDHTDRYRWSGDRFSLVDVRYAPSDFSYHRLIDGITAEQWGWAADAKTAYQDAMRPPTGALMEGIPPERQAQFEKAVPAYARFRLGVLLLSQKDVAGARRLAAEATGPYAGLVQVLNTADTAEAACELGTKWSGANPELFAALNSPYGYATPKIALCGPVQPGE